MVPEPTPSKFKQLISSRKIWAAFFGFALVIIKAWKPDFPLSADQLTGIVYVLVAYIMGTSLEDGLSRIND